MTSPEIRTINHCTYTPYSKDPKNPLIANFIPKNPIYKLEMLRLAFGHRAVGELILESLRKKGPDGPHEQQLSSAVKLIWDGDVSAAASIVGDVDAEQIAQFAGRAINEEQSLLGRAAQDLKIAVKTLAIEQKTTVEAIETLRKDVTAMQSDLQETLQRIDRPNDRKDVDAQAPTQDPVRQNRPDTVLVRPNFIHENISQLHQQLTRIEDSVQGIQGQKPLTTKDVFDKLAVRTDEMVISPDTITYLKATDYFPALIDTSSNIRRQMARAMLSTESQQIALNRRKEQIQTLSRIAKVVPVGYLHLERLNFTPVGYKRGELVYSLPMLPGETVRVSHREWSRTETEYLKLVQTSLETAAEDALSEKSELTESFNAQNQHNSAFNASASVSGGYGPINFSSSVGYSAQHAEASSRQSSTKRAQEIMHKASSRAKEEHKISFKVTTTYETEEQSFREIKNPLNRCVRWDFHRLMKKWRIDLFRYDIRLTYDIIVPEPASYLLGKFYDLMQIEEDLTKPFSFTTKPSEITPETYLDLSKQYGATLNDPPPLRSEAMNQVEIVYTQDKEPITDSIETHFYLGNLDLTLPDGYKFVVGRKVFLTDKAAGFSCYSGKGYEVYISEPTTGAIGASTDENLRRLCGDVGGTYSRNFQWSYYYFWLPGVQPGTRLFLWVRLEGELTEEGKRKWQNDCYEHLLDAAKLQYEANQEQLRRKRNKLLEELSREDALMLRKLEKEEIMKAVLRWLVGPGFVFYSHTLPSLSLGTEGDIEYYESAELATMGQSYSPSEWATVEAQLRSAGELNPADSQGVKPEYYMPMLEHGKLIQFLHHAIEWENVVYVLYPYFWTDTSRWNFKQSLYHNDYVHRSFLRSGAARVVLTIRPGYEDAFLSYMETLSLEKAEKALEEGSLYYTIAQEIKDMARTTYPYTESANVETGTHVDTWYEFTPTGALDVAEGTVLEDEKDWFEFPTENEVSQVFSDSHPAVDLAAPVGLRIRAAATGVVIWSTTCTRCTDAAPNIDPDSLSAANIRAIYADPNWGFGYGNSATIRYGYKTLPMPIRKKMDELGYQNGFAYVLYGHLSRVNVKINEDVDKDKILGLTGNTGMVTGPNLHVEVRVGGDVDLTGIDEWIALKAVNPELMFV